MLCLSPVNLGDVVIPCGRCMPCRINRVRAWTIRILMEYQSFDCKGLFVTLTYDDEHLPANGTLVKKHLQNYIKRLRRDLEPRKIKYFACGEYGSNTYRPHYHLIILGVDNNDIDFIKENWSFCNWRYMQKSAVGTVTADSIQYVAGYVQKKIYGSLSKSEYEDKGLIPPFQLQSQAFGLSYCQEHLSEYINVKGIPYKGHIAPFPRYFKEKLNFPDTFFEDLQSDIECHSYEDYLEKCRKAWISGKHGKRFHEAVYQTNQTEENYKKRFELTQRGKL